MNKVIVTLCSILINVLLTHGETRRNYNPSSYKRDPCGCDAYPFYDPVCASNGRTYDNKLVLDCERRCEHLDIYEIHLGECREQSNYLPAKNHDPFKQKLCNCASRYEYDPVCGEDEQTYENLDQLVCYNKCDGFRILALHRGECRERSNLNPTRVPDALRSRPCDCVPTGDYNPICGSDGRTYSNTDELICFNRCDNLDIRRLYRGECREQYSFDYLKYRSPFGQEPCECFKSYEGIPICGSDGRTYGNYGDLECVKKCHNANLYMLHEGECPDDPIRYSRNG